MILYLLADDAGIGDTATSNIVEAWQQNLLNGFSIVANRDCFLYIQKALKGNFNKECILSAHLNLTDGKSISVHGEKSLIADANGQLRISFVRALFLVIMGGNRKQLFLKEVYSEWDAQLNFIKEVCHGRKLNAINGHNHVHMIPSLFRIAAELSQKHAIPCVRVPKEHFSFSTPATFLRLFFYRNLSKLVILSVCRFFIKKKLAMCATFTEEVFGVLFSGHITKETVLASISNANKRGVSSIEFIFHPGQSKPSEMEKWASYRSGKNFFVHPNRRKELDILKQLRYDQSSESNSL